MKKEFKILENGNYEEVISAIQHKCHDMSFRFYCLEFGSELGKLYLEIEDGDPYEDGYCTKIEVNFCPFCGYKPESKKKID